VTRDRTRRVKPPGVAKALLAWYGRAGRDLPWRRSRDPYRIWVSEVMLQQTQVERVREFFARFIARLPTVAALAAAREAEVLRLWEGLGYYRRARQLHQAAQRIMADHAGEFPRTAAALRGLPGIGRYTAGAIASIAFDEPGGVSIGATVHSVGRTGVEMEALMAVSAAALTLYDMTKSIDPGMTIDRIRLEEKTGGTRGDWNRGTGRAPRAD